MPDMPREEDDDSGVLRPYVGRPSEPLPPVVPPSLRPPPPPPVVPPKPTPPAEPVPPAVESSDLLSDWMSDKVDDTPPHKSKPGTVAVSRKILGSVTVIAVALIVGLVYLWQSSGSDSSVTAADGVATPTTVPTAAAEGAAAQGSTTTTAAPSTTLANTVDGLQSQVQALEEQLASVPAPALPGASLQRIVVSAEASFVSASDTSVAVVGPFGNFANIDPATNAVVAAGQVAPGATRVIRTATSVWITDYSDSKLVWINPATNIVNQTFDFPGPDGLAKDGKSLVISSFDNGVVARFDPAVGKVVEQVSVGGNPTAIAVSDQGGIWAAIFNTGELVRIDPSTFTISDRIPVGAGPVGIALSPGTVWVANHDEGTIAEVSIAERKVISTIEVGEGPTELLVDSGSLWVTVTGAGDLLQIDVATGKVVTRTPLGGVSRGGGPTGISAGAGSIWVAIEGEQSVVRVTLPS